MQGLLSIKKKQSNLYLSTELFGYGFYFYFIPTPNKIKQVR
jgi:hypothetical protein